MKKYLFIILTLVLIFSFQISAQNSMDDDQLRFINDVNNTGSLFVNKEIKLNDFRVMPIFEDIGIVSEPEYFFQKNREFPLGHQFFILKMEDSKGDRKYIPVKLYRSGLKSSNRYWIYRARTYLFGSRVEIIYEFTKKKYLWEDNINYLELIVTIESENRINAELEFTNYFLAKRYTRGKGFLYGLSNYDEKSDLYDNMIIKRWQGNIKKVYNVRTYQGEDKYESIEYKMGTSVIRKGFTNRIGKLDLFYTRSNTPEQGMKFFEEILY